MGVSLEKVEAQAPQHVVDLYKKVGVSLEKKGLNPSAFNAAVIATLDNSGSTEMGQNRLYSDGTIQRVLDIAFAAALQFDDDGDVPVSVFNSRVDGLGEMNLGNCSGFLGGVRAMGGTDYVRALQWIVDEAGFGGVNLGGSSGGMFSRKSSGGLSVKATAPYPTYALFVTDGEPGNRPEEIEEYLTLMSQLPIFVQFVGVGTHNFNFLKGLDDLGGRLIDNANFFDSKEAGGDQGKILELMLAEFPDYYTLARQAGLISQGAPVPS